MPPHPIPLIDRFSRSVGRKAASGCILWIGCTNKDGYGVIGSGTRAGRMLLASRAVEVNRSVVVHLTRLQYGFLPERSLAQTQEILDQLQDLVRQMNQSLHSPSKFPPPAVPLK